MVRIRTLLFDAVLLALGLLMLWLFYQFLAGAVFPLFSGADATGVSQHPGDQPSAVEDIYQVDIRNGAGVSGLAEEMRVFLREQGYDVAEVGNHTSFEESKTIIVDRVGNLEIARKIATTLKLPEDRIQQDIKQHYYLDASIIIGKDYTLIPPFAADSLLTQTDQ